MIHRWMLARGLYVEIHTDRELMPDEWGRLRDYAERARMAAYHVASAAPVRLVLAPSEGPREGKAGLADASAPTGPR